MKRREFSKKMVHSVLSYSLLNALILTEAIGNKLNPITDHWANQINEYCLDVATSSMTLFYS